MDRIYIEHNAFRREREKKRERKRQTDRERKRERETDRVKERQRQRERHTHTHTRTHTIKHTHRLTDHHAMSTWYTHRIKFECEHEEMNKQSAVNTRIQKFITGQKN